MSPIELSIAFGIPTLTTLIGNLLNFRAIDETNKRLGRLEERVTKLEEKMDVRFNRMDDKLDKISAELHRCIELVVRHDKAIEVLEKRS